MYSLDVSLDAHQWQLGKYELPCIIICHSYTRISEPISVIDRLLEMDFNPFSPVGGNIRLTFDFEWLQPNQDRDSFNSFFTYTKARL